MQIDQADAVSGSSDSLPAASARARLRDATNAAHLRLHVHPAFAALQSGAIDRTRYRTLLARLFGFHQPLERALRASSWGPALGFEAVPPRADRLRDDLLRLGLPEPAFADLPSLAPSRLPALDTPGRFLGCLYVREGSSMGGRLLARQLDGILGDLPDGTTGRRFFRGTPHDAAVWRSCCAAIETMSEAGPLQDMIGAAGQTFSALEAWLDETEGWTPPS
jgi:heme oxygenase